MKIRITKRTEYKDAVLMPAELHDIEEKDALKFIEADAAIAWDEDEKPKKKAKAVNDGNG